METVFARPAWFARQAPIGGIYDPGQNVNTAFEACLRSATREKYSRVADGALGDALKMGRDVLDEETEPIHDAPALPSLC